MVMSDLCKGLPAPSPLPSGSFQSQQFRFAVPCRDRRVVDTWLGERLSRTSMQVFVSHSFADFINSVCVFNLSCLLFHFLILLALGMIALVTSFG